MVIIDNNTVITSFSFRVVKLLNAGKSNPRIKLAIPSVNAVKPKKVWVSFSMTGLIKFLSFEEYKDRTPPTTDIKQTIHEAKPEILVLLLYYFALWFYQFYCLSHDDYM